MGEMGEAFCLSAAGLERRPSTGITRWCADLGGKGQVVQLESSKHKEHRSEVKSVCLTVPPGCRW